MAGLGVGGAAAQGLEAGFGMGLRADAANEARKQREFENNRQTAADTERTAQTARSNARQDKQDAYAEDDRALTGLDKEMQDHALYGAGLAAQYGGPAKIPGDVGGQYATKAQDIGNRRTALLRKRYEPEVKQEQQWARDTASRIQAGQMSMDDLSPTETVRLIQANTRRPVSDFLRTDGGNSRVKQSIDDTTAGIETGNQSLMIQGAGGLLAPDLQTGLGHTTSDGSQIIRKDLYALLPAPQAGGQQQPQQASNPVQGLTAALNQATGVGGDAGPGEGGQQPQQPQPGQPQQPQPGQPAGSDTLMPSSQPGRLMPVLQVTARHPDGTEVQYHAPITKGRGVGPDDEVHPGIEMGDAMEHMGKLGTLESWMNTPQARAKIEQGLKEMGGNANSFLGAYYAMHGDAKALLPAGSEDPTTKKIAAYTKAAKEAGVPLGDYVRMIEGKGATGLQAKLDTIDASDLSDQDKAQARKVAMGIVKVAAPKAEGGTDLSPEAIDQTAAAALKDRNALVGIGRDPNKVTKVLNRMAELSPGGDVAGNRALFGADKKSLDKMIPQYDAVTSFENNTLQQGKVLVDLAKKVDITGIPVVERWIRNGRRSIAGDPDVSEFNAQLQLFGNEAAKILTNPNLTGVLSDSARHEVAGFLPSNATAEQVERVVSRLEKDFEIRRKSIEDQTATITKRMADRNPTPATGISGGGGTRVAPADQAARDNDALGILQQERGAITARLTKGDTRAQGDLDAIDKEIALAQKRSGVRPAATGIGGGRTAAPAGTQTAVNPKTGERLMLQNGQWVPFK